MAFFNYLVSLYLINLKKLMMMDFSYLVINLINSKQLYLIQVNTYFMDLHIFELYFSIYSILNSII